MAKKDVNGQMDMFELFSFVEELEQKVKTIPDEEELEKLAEEVILPKFEDNTNTTAVMEKCFSSSYDKKPAVIAYIDYNKVYVRLWNEKPITYQFQSSKSAVDYYVGLIDKLQEDENVQVLEEKLPIEISPMIAGNE